MKQINSSLVVCISRKSVVMVICLACLICAGCGSLPKTVATRPNSPQQVVSANVVLLADTRLSEALHAYTTHPAIEIPQPYQYNFFEDLKPAIAESGFSSWFSHFSLANPAQDVQADLFLLPYVKVLQVDYPMMSYNDTKMRVDLGVTFLDNKRVSIFEANSSGEIAFNIANPKRTLRAAHIAFTDSLSKLSLRLTADPQITFVFTHARFFNMDDDSKLTALPQLLSESSTKEKFGPVLLTYAIRGNYVKLLDGLLAQNVSPQNPATAEELPPLHLAAQNNRSEIISKLVAAGAPVNSRDKENHLPIFYSAWTDSHEATHRLLDLNSEVDIFQPDLPVTSVQKTASFGDYYATKWNKEKASFCYDMALKAASSSAVELKTASARARSKRHWQTFAIIVLGAVQGAAQQMAYDSQQQFQAKQDAQFDAMKRANAAGTGFGGYYSGLPSSYARMSSLARDQSSLATMFPRAQTLGYENQALGMDLKAKEKALLKLSEQAEQEAGMLRRKLAALEKTTSYDQFKEQVGKSQ